VQEFLGWLLALVEVFLLDKKGQNVGRDISMSSLILWSILVNVLVKNFDYGQW